MSKIENIYVSLDEARAALEKRAGNSTLRERIERELGERFIPEFKDKPQGVLWKYLLSPDNSFAFFLHLCAYAKVAPLVLEYFGDMFITINEEKKGLGRLRVKLPDGSKKLVEILDFPASQRKRMDEVTLTTGERLLDFHHRLLSVSKYETGLRDQTDWAHSIGKPADYYYPYLAHFIAHGILFESYLTDDPDEREVAFTREVVAPAMDRLEAEFGLRPLIVRLFPEQQDEEEDFYWWSYPPHVNDYVVKYVETGQCEIEYCTEDMESDEEWCSEEPYLDEEGMEEAPDTEESEDTDAHPVPFSWMNPKLEVRRAGGRGKGVFARETIEAGETLIIMGGYIIDIDMENRLDDFQRDKPIEISERFSFCPMRPSDMDRMPQHYVNHSCDPNTGFRDSNFMVAMRDIVAGEEILYDYAMVLASNPESSNYFQMTCACGSERCRGIIDEEGWKLPELQQRYAGYFQPYIEKRIAALGR